METPQPVKQALSWDSPESGIFSLELDDPESAIFSLEIETLQPDAKVTQQGDYGPDSISDVVVSTRSWTSPKMPVVA
jgi:hypothetical protein